MSVSNPLPENFDLQHFPTNHMPKRNSHLIFVTHDNNCGMKLLHKKCIEFTKCQCVNINNTIQVKTHKINTY